MRSVNGFQNWRRCFLLLLRPLLLPSANAYVTLDAHISPALSSTPLDERVAVVQTGSILIGLTGSSSSNETNKLCNSKKYDRVEAASQI